jgi:Tol biopolymer transport system component
MSAFPTDPPPALANDDRLDSWKQIASYLRRDVTTVQRWEKREGMPVHRHLHDKIGSVYAFRSELDSWTLARTPTPTVPENADAAPGGAVGVAAPIRWRRRTIVGLAVALLIGVVAALYFRDGRADSFLRGSIGDAQFQSITDFDATELAAAISRDGRTAAFLSDRDGRMDVWLTQIGSGRFTNLTRGVAQDRVNPSVRALNFSPDGTVITYWARKSGSTDPHDIGIWAVPAGGGAPRPFLEEAAEVAWSSDGRRLVYHTPAAGDPMYVTDGPSAAHGAPIFTAPEGFHAHFPLWSPDRRFIYFVQGSMPERLDIWRMTPEGRGVERVTVHAGRVSHPVWIDARTLIYLASDADGGPWLYTVDVERRAPRRLSSGLDRFTSLAASEDGRRIVATVARQTRTLWRFPIADEPVDESTATRVAASTRSAFAPREGPGYILYVSSIGGSDSIRRLAGGVTAEIWSGEAGARIVGGPSIAPDGQRLAVVVKIEDRATLRVMQVDGTNARVVSDSPALRGAPAWSSDGRALTIAMDQDGVPRLVSIGIDGSRSPPLVSDYSTDPVWSRDGRLLVYSGPDVGATFPVKAAALTGSASAVLLTLTRGARRLAFRPDRRALVFLRGTLDHKDVWTLDLDTGHERPLTTLAADFNVADFDLSPDGRELIVERRQEQSDLVMLDRRGGRP